MFRCEKCGKVTKAGEKQNKIVKEYRDKTYVYTDKHGNEQEKEGKEIVKEINVCENCFNTLKEVGE